MNDTAIDKPIGPVFLQAGFRFYFLSAGVFAILTMAVWIGWLAIHDLGGTFTSLPMKMPPHQWHAHEMLFGYIVAVMAGFFLTAVPNWTGAPSARTYFVAATGAVWIAGRLVLWASADIPAAVVAAVDLAFIPLLMLKIGGNLLRKTQLRNLVFLALLLAMFSGNLLMHLEWLGFLDSGADRGARLGLFTSAAMIVIIGGRVVPGFTRNALNRRGHEGALPATRPVIDRLAILSSCFAALASATDLPLVLLGLLCLCAGALNLCRLSGWCGLHVLREPILWVMHVAFLLLAAAYLVLAAGYITDEVSEVAGLHLLAIGGIGVMTLAMMTRASLGHTGRPLRVHRMIVVAYLCLIASAVVRSSAGGLIDYFQIMYISAAFWITAFVLYFLIYFPILAAEREAPSKS